MDLAAARIGVVPVMGGSMRSRMAQDPVDREAVLFKARAVTLLAGAIARIVPAIGMDWAGGANLVKAEAFIVMTQKNRKTGCQRRAVLRAA
jgi:hypothetical protein